ncbi:MAG: GNAT family N-acetyltransferase [Chitinophagaceae bacterium]|nr:MAG: GNAT family N-acetyltransferase [Chitinophagaceae bacterium]
MSAALQIRKASVNDLKEIASIYGFAVTNRQTAHTHPPPFEYWNAWLRNHNELFPAFVLINKQEVIGFASVSPYREGRQALEKVAEISYYLHPSSQGKGAGTFFVQKVIEQARSLEFKYLLAILLSSNSSSIALLNKLGFEKWGELPGVAEFAGDTVSHLYYGIRLRSGK